MIFIDQIKSELREIKTSRKELVRFGLVVGLIFIAISFIFKSSFGILFSIGAVLLLLAIFSPKALLYFYIFWMAIGRGMGFIVTRLLLVLFYFILIVPLGLVTRILGKDFLQKGENKKSYWVKKEVESNPDYPF
jgi:hypothetical protein